MVQEGNCRYNYAWIMIDANDKDSYFWKMGNFDKKLVWTKELLCQDENLEVTYGI